MSADRPPHDWSIAEAAEQIAQRAISPVEVTRSVLDRIAAVERRTRAYVTVLADQALAAAREAERALTAGEYRGPLHGIPIALKDIYDLAGTPTTASSPTRAGHLAQRDAATVARLKEAGAILIGKTVTDEFAYGTICPPTRNPWDLERIPGGSSGGSAAAVAAGECLGALGSDTAGSIRTPASLNGIAGLKPTYGRVSKRGLVPLAWSVDAAGPLTKQVADAALILNAIAGHDPADPTSAPEPVPDFTASLDQGVRGLRLGIVSNYYFAGADPEVVATVRAAIEVLRGAGAEIREIEVPFIDYSFAAGRAIVRSEATAYHEAQVRRPDSPYGANTRLVIEAGALVPAIFYLKAQRARVLIKRGFQTALSTVDGLLSPALPATAVRVDQFGDEAVGSQAFQIINDYVRWAYPANLAGLPALSVPCGFSREGLPIGLQIIGRPFDEATVLRIGRAYETATDWHERRPGLY